jgi:hypothetical protein
VKLAAICAAVVVVLMAGGDDLQLPGPSLSSEPKPTAIPGDSTRTPVAANAAKVLRSLNILAVKGRAAKTGYSRAAFGQAWADVDRNGCDTRNEILSRDLSGVTYKPRTHECVVLTGTLDDPYTGRTIHFKRGESTSRQVQIDHVVALADAWQTGAAYFDDQKREQLANDPLELLAVDGSINESKGDGDAATWLPPSKTYRCAYVSRQIAVKVKYSLWVTKAEKAAMERVLGNCP